MKNNPLITVIIPVYNVEQHLEECISSVLTQEYKDFEIVLVNDGSTDNSPAICDEFAKKDARVIVIHKKNEGVGFARNSGIRAARGKYLYFLDSDDFIESNFFEIVISDTTKNYDVVQFGFNRVSQIGKHLNTCIPEAMEINNLHAEKEKLAQMLDSGTGLAVWDKLIKREVLVKNNLFFDNKKRGEDFTFIIQLFQNINGIYVINKSLINYRIIMGSGKKFDPNLTKNHIENWRLLTNLLNDHSLSSERYLKRIFSIWFFKVIPIHMGIDNSLSLKQKMVSLNSLNLDFEFATFLKIKADSFDSFFDRSMVYFYQTKHYRLIIIIGKSLSIVRKFIYK
jgi:glycosyltransferase involved in cell wall biosynthesis